MRARSPANDLFVKGDFGIFNADVKGDFGIFNADDTEQIGNTWSTVLLPLLFGFKIRILFLPKIKM